MTSVSSVIVRTTGIILVTMFGVRPVSAQVVSVQLPDMPETNLDIFDIVFEPNTAPPSTLINHRPGHRHPGSVLVYVIEGALRLALEGEDVRVVQAGGTFFEPPGVHHIITENASATERARALIIMLVPEGEPRNMPGEQDGE